MSYYVSPNCKSKKELRELVKDGKTVRVFQPNAMFSNGEPPLNGNITIEGPHYPQPHRWYAIGIMKDGKLVVVK